MRIQLDDDEVMDLGALRAFVAAAAHLPDAYPVKEFNSPGYSERQGIEIEWPIGGRD